MAADTSTPLRKADIVPADNRRFLAQICDPGAVPGSWCRTRADGFVSDRNRVKPAHATFLMPHRGRPLSIVRSPAAGAIARSDSSIRQAGRRPRGLRLPQHFVDGPRQDVRPVRIADRRRQVDAIAPAEHILYGDQHEIGARVVEAGKIPSRTVSSKARELEAEAPSVLPASVSHQTARGSVSCVPVIATDSGGNRRGSYGLPSQNLVTGKAEPRDRLADERRERCRDPRRSRRRRSR